MGDVLSNKMDDYVIGIVGGMGSYATVKFFERIIDSYPVEREWERPRIVIDNKCTMPSRVRSILYDENTDLLISELTDSVRGLMDMGATKIVLACNTSHCFLPEVLKNVPEAEDKIVHIITSCAEMIKRDGLNKVFLMATEGTLLSKIYENTFEPYGIECVAATEDDFPIMREYIEAVKQKRITDEMKDDFVNYINNAETDAVILGCTELPILYAELGDKKTEITKKIYDPLDAALLKIKNGTV